MSAHGYGMDGFVWFALAFFCFLFFTFPGATMLLARFSFEKSWTYSLQLAGWVAIGQIIVCLIVYVFHGRT